MSRHSIGRASAGEDQEQNFASLADHDPANPMSSDERDAPSGATRGQRGTTDEASGKRRTMPVKIVRDYWADEDAKDEWPSPAENRIAAGRVIELAVREARRLIKAGVAERADPLPEE